VELPDFIGSPGIERIQKAPLPEPSVWTTLFVSGGRKDKISKGDLAGLFFKQGKLSKDQLGIIELKQDCACVHTSEAQQLIQLLDNSKLKNKKIRVTFNE